MADASTTALVLTGATVSQTGKDIESAAPGAHIVIDITAISGTAPTATFTVQGKDPASGKYYNLLSSAALGAVGTTVLRIHPGLAATAELVANDVLPQTVRVIVAIAGTTPSVTATVGMVFASSDRWQLR